MLLQVYFIWLSSLCPIQCTLLEHMFSLMSVFITLIWPKKGDKNVSRESEIHEALTYTGYFYPSHAEHMMDSKEIGEAD